MSLITEDGTGRADAESYASVSAADAYHAARGNTAWAALATSAKEISLRNATEYLTQIYRERWKGSRVYAAQALDWPRYGVCVDDIELVYSVIPADLIKACCELALKASTSSLSADESAQVKSVTVGPITKVYADGARQNKRYAAVDNMLRSLLQAGGGIKVVRA